jgi:methylenetetrahydrofolate dehydrogenase (NADP+) / methenyltetrahydrofolate cyclohydrolase
MTATLIDGKATSDASDQEVARAVAALRSQYQAVPTLAVVLVGHDPASQVYVRNKARRTLAAGMGSVEIRLPDDIAQQALDTQIKALSDDPEIDGILLQLPLPAGLDANQAIGCIDPAKDVDGLTEISAGRLVLGRAGLRPCTPVGSVMLAKQALGALSGKHVVVIGRSILVGKPAALLFLAEDCTVTMAHSRTANLAEVCREADILVAAVGRPQMVKASWIKPGACVIDVGINRVAAPEKGIDGSRLVGDVAFEEAMAVAGSITPVPGGVGPMTIACLLRNTLLAACARRGWAVPQGFAA